jgi:hypothetical protein
VRKTVGGEKDDIWEAQVFPVPRNCVRLSR